MDAKRIDALCKLFSQEVDQKTIPGAVLGAASSRRIFFRESVGFRQVTPERLPMTVETLFDLASLTKVVATTSMIFRALEQGALRLDDLVSRFLPGEFGTVRISHLMTHTSGFPGWLDLTGFSREAREPRIRAILESTREYPVGERVLYSDLNFILLGHILERISASSLDVLFAREVAVPLGMKTAGFTPSVYAEVAATEMDEDRQKPYVGVVHDENARAAGGVLGHAGLFGTLDDLLIYGQTLLRLGQGLQARWISEASVNALKTARTIGLPGELRAYGYQKPHPLSSAGDLMSASAIGHTGFTGTSIWIDFDYDVVMVALTNRVHFGRSSNAPIRLRPIFHNMVLSSL